MKKQFYSGYVLWLFMIVMFTNMSLKAQTKTVLMFVSFEDTYYSEYIVTLKALQAAGYTVDVRSADTQSFSSYMLPVGTDIQATANTLAGSNYTQFTQQFQSLFGGNWNATWNTTQTLVAHNGKIQDVPNMNNYDALIIPGGTGAMDYRVDGAYNSQGTGARLINSTVVQAAALKVNSLALEALQLGKPILAQCHAASLPVFWRIPSTTGPGAESIGFSLLKGKGAAGYPDPNTATTYSTLNVTHLTNDRVTVSTPHNSFNHNGQGDYKIITSADWYPQTVAHAVRTLLNMLESYPTKAQRESSLNCLILHGGAVDSTGSNCQAANLANDVPCNYGNNPNLPADYRHLQNLLNANSALDNYSITASQLNLSGSLPYNGTSTTAILAYLQQYDVVIFFKHWATDVTPELQTALVAYADGGKGVMALHHGLYNHISGSLNKNILVNQLFGAESAMATWSGALTNYDVFSTNYGHFISSYGVTYTTSAQAPAAWSTATLLLGSNSSFSTYQRFGIYDEIYNNMAFVAGQTFGRGIGQINSLFSNNQLPGAQCHTNGFIKLFNPSNDGTIGRLAFFQAGERRENFSLSHPYAQVIRNAVVWSGKFSNCSAAPASPLSFSGSNAVCAQAGLTYSVAPVQGASDYLWALPAGWTGSTSGSSIVANAGNSGGTMSVQALNSCGLSIPYVVSLTVNPLPTITVNSGTLCAGGNFTISPAGAGSYSVSGGSFVVSPGNNSTYTVTGTSSLGCAAISPALASVSVFALPVVSVNSGVICAGQAFTIVPSGASIYTIQGGSNTVSPSANTSYTVSGSNNQGCISQNAATSNVTVNANPTITVNSGTICAGQMFTIVPSGASTYTIQGGSNTVSPVANNSYSVSGTNLAGCVSQHAAVSHVTVNPNPTISVNSGTICAGQMFTIVPSGASTYTIQGGSNTVSPATNNSYSISGTNVAGCVSQHAAVSHLTVNANPTISVNSGTICAGQTFTIVPSGASTYTIQGGSNTVSPVSNSTYSIAGAGLNGCVSQAVISNVTVNPNPTITATSSRTLICIGESAVITASGAVTYSVFPASSGASVVLTPTFVGGSTYTILGTDANGCAGSAVVTLNVDACTGINHLSQQIQSAMVQIYPNPSSGIFKAEFSFEGNKTILLYNQMGQLVLSMETDKQDVEINLNRFENGIYFVKIRGNNGLNVKKIIKA